MLLPFSVNLYLFVLSCTPCCSAMFSQNRQNVHDAIQLYKYLCSLTEVGKWSPHRHMWRQEQNICNVNIKKWPFDHLKIAICGDRANFAAHPCLKVNTIWHVVNFKLWPSSLTSISQWFQSALISKFNYTQISRNFQGRRRNTRKKCLQNSMDIE